MSTLLQARPRHATPRGEGRHDRRSQRQRRSWSVLLCKHRRGRARHRRYRFGLAPLARGWLGITSGVYTNPPVCWLARTVELLPSLSRRALSRRRKVLGLRKPSGNARYPPGTQTSSRSSKFRVAAQSDRGPAGVASSSDDACPRHKLRYPQRGSRDADFARYAFVVPQTERRLRRQGARGRHIAPPPRHLPCLLREIYRELGGESADTGRSLLVWMNDSPGCCSLRTNNPPPPIMVCPPLREE